MQPATQRDRAFIAASKRQSKRKNSKINTNFRKLFGLLNVCSVEHCAEATAAAAVPTFARQHDVEFDYTTPNECDDLKMLH